MNDTTALGGHHMKLDPQLHAALDPGKWKMGLCLSYGGSLVYATAVHVSAPWDFTKAVNAVLDAAVAFNGSLPSHWAIEWPRFYGGQGRSASRKDVEALGDLAKRLEAELKPLGATVVLARPHEWKGNVAKRVNHRRVQRAMTQVEIAAVWQDYGDAHLDVWDAISIEMWSLDRVGRGGTRR